MSQLSSAPGPLSERMSALKADVMARGASEIAGQNPCLPALALWRASEGHRSRVQVRARYLRELVQLAPLEIRPHWRLAGEHLPPPPTLTAFDALSDQEVQDCLRELGVEAGKAEDLRRFLARWRQAEPERMAYAVGEMEEASLVGRGDGGSLALTPPVVFAASGWIENHSIRDFQKVLRVGFGGLREEIDAARAAADLASPDYPQQENFWRAALYVCEAGMLLGRRYAALASALAAQAVAADDRRRLQEMAELCARVPAWGARTFAEAVQSLWLCQILTCGEDCVNANSIGRLDQILYPWYKADLEAERITRAEALELMEELACKLYREYDVQAIILGGQDAQGQDAVNDLSYIILDATERVDVIRDLAVRLDTHSPDAFVERTAALIARGGGIPFIFNDACYIRALNERGIALADARDYAPIGCIELTIPGRANPHAVSGWFNAAKCLELALFDGCDPRTGIHVGPRTGTLADHADFEDFYRAYTAQVDTLARRMVYVCNRGELAQREFGPLPCWSVMTDDCIARGRDITDGGAVYNYHSICFMGSANIADSMLSISRLVFDQKAISAEELLAALRADFEGHESLRQMLLKRVPKYGNDAPEVDEIACRVCNDFISLMDTHRSPLGGRYYVHLFTWRQHLYFGKHTGATPDGRKAGEPLAYSLSAMQGRDEEGVTALLHSLARLPHHRAGGASAAIVEVDPGLVEGDQGIERLAQIIRGALALGVGQLQWNVTTVERLLLAQRDPELYGNIPVRVAGYSQMFRLIDKELQDHIIARTKHSH
ncbi:MAG: pyruvate formate lyase family protein [Anaerolineae bacterium]